MQNQNEQIPNEEKKKSKKKYLLLLLLLLILLVALIIFIPRCQSPSKNINIENEKNTEEEVKDKPPTSMGVSLGTSAIPSSMKPGMYSTVKIKAGNSREEELEIYNIKLTWSLKKSDGTESIISTEEINKNSEGWNLDGKLQKDEKIVVYEINKTLNDLGVWTLKAEAETSRGNIESDIDINVRNK